MSEEKQALIAKVKRLQAVIEAARKLGEGGGKEKRVKGESEEE